MSDSVVNFPKPEAKPSRTMQEIQSEYQGICARTGQLQYQIFTFTKDLALLNDKLRDLNFEAAKVQQEETAKAATAEATPEKESVNA